MAYQMAATIVTLNDLERYSSVAGFFKCNPSNICAAFYTISTDSVLVRFLCISKASCYAIWLKQFVPSSVGVAARRKFAWAGTNPSFTTGLHVFQICKLILATFI